MIFSLLFILAPTLASKSSPDFERLLSVLDLKGKSLTTSLDNLADSIKSSCNTNTRTPKSLDSNILEKVSHMFDFDERLKALEVKLETVQNTNNDDVFFRYSQLATLFLLLKTFFQIGHFP